MANLQKKLDRTRNNESNAQISLSFTVSVLGCDEVRSLNLNSTTFKLRMFSTDSKFYVCFKRLVVEREFMLKSLFHD